MTLSENIYQLANSTKIEAIYLTEKGFNTLLDEAIFKDQINENLNITKYGLEPNKVHILDINSVPIYYKIGIDTSYYIQDGISNILKYKN